MQTIIREQYRGYNASKREYFYGVKIQLITTADGIPVEMYLVEAREHDSQTLQRMHHDLPPESTLYGDSGYTDYEIEDFFNETYNLKIGNSDYLCNGNKRKCYL